MVRERVSWRGLPLEGDGGEAAMFEEIEVGDWISWPGVLGRDQGKVIATDGQSYNVQTRKGDNPVYTKVPKGKGVTKIDPPAEG